MTDESMRSALETFFDEQDWSTKHTVKMVDGVNETAFYLFDEESDFGSVICTTSTYDAYMAMEDAVTTDKEAFYDAFAIDAMAKGFPRIIDKYGKVELLDKGYGPYEQPVMTMTTGLGTMVVYQFGTRNVCDEFAIDLIHNGKTCNLAIVGVDEDEEKARVYAYDTDEATRIDIPLDWRKPLFEDLTFKKTCMVKERQRRQKRYEVYVTIQDADSTDWLIQPFEYGTDNLEEAYEVYRMILKNRDRAIEKCRKALDMTDDEFAKVEWFELRLEDFKSGESIEEPEAL